jgi:hypothetical protein
MDGVLEKSGLKAAARGAVDRLNASVGVHLRCDEKAFRSNPSQYGLLPKSYYRRVFDRMNPADMRRVVVFQQPASKKQAKCVAASEMLMHLLREKISDPDGILDFDSEIQAHPPPEAVARRDKTAFTWAVLTQMPKLVLPLSSFSLSAAMCSKGDVHAPAARGGAVNVGDTSFPGMGSHWHWLRTDILSGKLVRALSLEDFSKRLEGT